MYFITTYTINVQYRIAFLIINRKIFRCIEVSLDTHNLAD